MLGDNLTIKECFDKAVDLNNDHETLHDYGTNPIKYIGLQWGRECYGSTDKYGSYGKVDDEQCSMVCTNDIDYKCGDDWRNSVYDITAYTKSDLCQGKV